MKRAYSIALSVCVLSVAALAIGFSSTPPQPATAVEADNPVCRTEQFTITPKTCNGTFVNGVCKGPGSGTNAESYFDDIQFANTYSQAPIVFVTINSLPPDEGVPGGLAQPNCISGGSDHYKAFAENITTTGARIFASGSPVEDWCGNYSGWGTYLTVDVTVYDRATCGAQGANKIAPTSCLKFDNNGNSSPATEHDGLCKSPKSTEYTFPTSYTEIPHMLVSPGFTNKQSGCVGNAVSHGEFYPMLIGRESATVVGSGKPWMSCGQYSGYYANSEVGVVAIAQNKGVSGHGISVNECNGVTGKDACPDVFKKHIQFPKKFINTPTVALTIERFPTSACSEGLADRAGCRVEPGSVTTEGFVAVCDVSPYDFPWTSQTVPADPLPIIVESNNGSGFICQKGGKSTEVFWLPQYTTVAVPPTKGCGQAAHTHVQAEVGYIATGELAVAAPQIGCITIQKTAKNPAGDNLITVPTAFTFTLDGDTTKTTTNDSSGHAQFTNVTPGNHTITESMPTGWHNQTPTSVTINVPSGSQCPTVNFTNQQNAAQSQTGCIDIQKEAFASNGITAITPVPQFTFRLDNGVQTAYSDPNGIAHFTNVSVGQHTVSEVVPAGWDNYLITPTGGTVNVPAGSNCPGIVYKNRQTVVNSPALSVTCPNPNSINVNQSATFNATANGGNGTYTFQWSGDCSGFNSNGGTSTCTNTFNSAGSKIAYVQVTSGNQIQQTSCSVNVNQPNNQSVNAFCVPSQNPINVNQTVTFNGTPSGGTGNYTYQWTGNCTASSQNCSTSFGSAGTYTTTFQVASGNQTAQTTCTVTVNNPNTTCTQNSYQQCYNNAVYWYDSCGNRQNITQSCSSNQTCQNNTCVTNVVQNGNFTLTKTVRNITAGNFGWSSSVNANPGDIVQFNLAITASGNQSTNITNLRDTLPTNLSYADAMLVDGAVTGGNVTSGISLGTINPGQTKNVQFNAQVAGAQNFQFGSTTLINTVLATDSSGNQRTATASVIVNKAGVGGATDVSTGLLSGNPLVDSFFLPLLLIIGGFLVVRTWRANWAIK